MSTTTICVARLFLDSSWHFFLYLKYVRSDRTNQLNFKCICSSLSLKSACDERWWPFKWEKKSWWPRGTGRAQIVSFLNSPRSRLWQAFPQLELFFLFETGDDRGWGKTSVNGTGIVSKFGQDFALNYSRSLVYRSTHPEHQYTQRDKRSLRYKQMNIQLGANVWSQSLTMELLWAGHSTGTMPLKARTRLGRWGTTGLHMAWTSCAVQQNR